MKLLFRYHNMGEQEKGRVSVKLYLLLEKEGEVYRSIRYYTGSRDRIFAFFKHSIQSESCFK